MRALYMVFVILLFNDTLQSTTAKEKNCMHLLHHLAACQQFYVSCSTSHAVPVKLCIDCKIQYEDMKEAFQNLTNNPNCTQMYFNHDRINVIQTTQNMLLNLWKKAYCDDCFQSDNAIKFKTQSDILNDCFYKNKKDVCAACLIPYLELNKFYTNLDQKNNGEVCYDLQDAMNQTRVYWSKTLNCCHREFHMILFLVTALCVGSLPIIFYSTSYILTRRRERNHAVLNISENIDDNRAITNIPSVDANQTLLEQPSTDPLLNEKFKLQIDEDSDTDDENMPKMQKLS